MMNHELHNKMLAVAKGTKIVTTSRTMPAVLMIAVLMIVGVGCEQAPDLNEKVQEVPRNVRVLNLAGETIDQFFEISGPVAPVRGADLSAQESGPVVDIAVAKGAAVQAGQMIVEQDRNILRAEKDEAAAALEAQAYNVDKVRQLHKAGKVSRIELLTAESTFAQAQALAEITAERYRRAGIQAPFAGVVVERYVELGQLVVPGMPVVRVIDPYTLKLEAYLTDQQVRWVTEGERAEVLLGESTAAASGHVTWVGFEADRLTGKFKVEVEIPNPDLTLRSGVIGRARLGKNLVQDVVAIPRDAVLNGRVGPTAYVVENDHAVLRQLVLGESQGLMVIVTDGLNKGDQLVVRGHRDLREGGLVKITETARTADGATAADPVEVTDSGAASRVPTGAADTAGLNDGDVEAGQ